MWWIIGGVVLGLVVGLFVGGLLMVAWLGQAIAIRK